MTPTHDPIRIGIDLGGTKIAGIAIGPEDVVMADDRVPTPREDYDGTIAAIAAMVARLAAAAGAGPDAPVGVGMPGSLAPGTGLVQNANSTWLNGRAFAVDLAASLGRRVRAANDANCFALSEAYDGAAAGCRHVFGVIIGTGCGGGLILEGRIVQGRRNIGGEWGHNPLPWPDAAELPGPLCWCGRSGCLETWVSGPAIMADHARSGGAALAAEGIAALSTAGDVHARATLDRHANRLARGLAAIVNVIDPEVIVLGGGLSDMPHLYQQLPELMAPYIFADDRTVDIWPPRWGAASGVRGAARLWGAG